jgi:hypothetical protein
MGILIAPDFATMSDTDYGILCCTAIAFRPISAYLVYSFFWERKFGQAHKDLAEKYRVLGMKVETTDNVVQLEA